MQPLLIFLVASAILGLRSKRLDVPLSPVTFLVMAFILAVTLYSRRFL